MVVKVGMVKTVEGDYAFDCNYWGKRPKLVMVGGGWWRQLGG